MTAMLNRLFLAIAVLAAIGSASPSVMAAPKAELWPRWQAFDAASTKIVDHSVFDGFLLKYVTPVQGGHNRVAYKDVGDADRGALAAYISSLSRVSVTTLRRDEQMAFWINLYNALTLKTVLDHYPVKSIRDIDISPGFFADGPWGKKLIEIDGELISLDDIEHRILRPIWKDPRLHFAVNCASVGCPDLRPVAYTAANVDAALTGAAKAYVNDRRGAEVKDGKLTVSSIYDWFRSDFGGNEAGVLKHLRRYAGPALSAQLANIGGIAGYAYDWRLNE
ncbi:MAG: DUF547 domain-containing protein [Proteobacteria bacterium]|nr:DUF547 domain-containing protein [Pseudomonadota bacterium]